MRPLLTVTRTGPAARPRHCRALRSDDGDLMIEADGRLSACSTLSPTAAWHRYRNLRLARQGWTTTFVRDDPEALTFEQVLEAIIPARHMPSPYAACVIRGLQSPREGRSGRLPAQHVDRFGVKSMRNGDAAKAPWA